MIVKQSRKFHCGKVLTFLIHQPPKCLNQADLANRLKVHPSQISRWIKQDDMKLSTVAKICSGLNINVEKFIIIGESLA
jgi:DNA-binding Xre family transcriptional regulator